VATGREIADWYYARHYDEMGRLPGRKAGRAMTLPREYLEYRHRRAGMDHDRYAYSNLSPASRWSGPGGARIALCIVPAVEFFPLDMKPQGFKAPGAMDRPHPDYWNYTLRDYGNRVGVFRVFAALDAHGLKASVAINARAAERMPFLVAEINRRGWEIVGHGLDMGHLHHGAMAMEEERALVRRSLATLRAVSGQAVTGWAVAGVLGIAQHAGPRRRRGHRLCL